jgi:DNA-binding transcriptional MerR regulator
VLTISQLASYAGTTPRAVRFYHQKGLLPEPERDYSGYRRYDAAAAVELIRIRTLADAGVPLSRVKELLAADEEEFRAAIEDIDRRLRAEIRDMQRHRKRIARLAAGDSLALPPEVVAYLNRMRELGIPERMIEGERDAWILVAAQLPDRMETYIGSKQDQLDDPSVVEFYRRLDDIIEWKPGDRRLPALADEVVAQLEAVPEEEWKAFAEDSAMTDDLVALLDAWFLSKVPVGAELMRLVEKRGWTGWTRQRRIER